MTFLKTSGGNTAFTAFNNPQGGFMHNDQYVFAIGIDDGKYRAYGASPQLTGMDGRGLRDATGKPVVEEIISLAKEKGSGTVDYMWRNPATNAVEQKISLIKRVDDVVLGVGYYTKQFKNTGCALGGRPARAVVADLVFSSQGLRLFPVC